MAEKNSNEEVGCALPPGEAAERHKRAPVNIPDSLTQHWNSLWPGWKPVSIDCEFDP